MAATPPTGLTQHLQTHKDLKSSTTIIFHRTQLFNSLVPTAAANATFEDISRKPESCGQLTGKRRLPTRALTHCGDPIGPELYFRVT
jgi:hypothetical protein